MTENEAKAVRFIEYIKKYAVETIDHIAKEDIIASTVTYTRKKEKAETILAMVEELEKYRAIGTVEECRAAMEKQTAIPREIIEGKYFCQKCHNIMPYPGYCRCGQKVY